MTLEEFKAKYPEIADAYKNEIAAAAKTAQTDNASQVEAERARIKAIDELTLPGYEDLANEAKYKTPISAEAFAVQMVAAQKKAGKNFLTDRERDIEDSGVNDVPPVSNKGGTQEEDPFGDIIDKLYPKTE